MLLSSYYSHQVSSGIRKCSSVKGCRKYLAFFGERFRESDADRYKKNPLLSPLCVGFFIHLLWEKFPVSPWVVYFPMVFYLPPTTFGKKNHCGRATATMGSVTSDSSSVVAEGAPALAAAGEGSAAAAGAAAGAAGGSASVQPGGENGWRKKSSRFRLEKTVNLGSVLLIFCWKMFCLLFAILKYHWKKSFWYNLI